MGRNSMSQQIPEGFVLEQGTQQIPEGFVLEAPKRQAERVGGGTLETTPQGRVVFHGYGPGNPFAQMKAEARDALGSVEAEALAKARELPEYQNFLQNFLFQDPQERIQVMRDSGLDVRTEGGFAFVTLPDGKEAVLNKPGFSRADAESLAGDMFTFLPAGWWASQSAGVIKPLAKAYAMAVGMAAAREGGQALAGGEFNVGQINKEGLLAAGGEGIGRGIARHLSKADPGLARQKAVVGEIKDMQKAFGDDALNQVDAILESGGKSTTRMMEVAPMSRAKAIELAKRFPDRAQYLEEYASQMARTQKKGLMKTFARMSDKPVDEALEKVASSTGKSLDDTIKTNRIYIDSMYKDAWANSKAIKTVPLRRMADKIINDEALVGSLSEKELLGLKKAFIPRQYWESKDLIIANLREQVKGLGESKADETAKSQVEALINKLENFEDVSDFALKGAASGVKIKIPKLPKMEMSPRMVQKAIFRIRDAMQGSGKSQSQELSANLAPLEKIVQQSMDAATGGRYSKADAAYRKMMEQFSQIESSFAKKVAGGSEMTYGDILGHLFNPKNGSERYAVNFVRQLRNVDPDAARDLVGAYYYKQLDDLGLETKPSNILKAIFGPDERSRRHVYDILGPKSGGRPIEAQRLMDVENVLKVGAKFEDISADDALARYVNGKLDPDVAHYVYVRLAISRAIKDKMDRNMAQTWFDVATAPEYFDEFKKLMQSRNVLRTFSGKDAAARAKAAQTAQDLIEDAVKTLAAPAPTVLEEPAKATASEVSGIIGEAKRNIFNRPQTPELPIGTPPSL